MKNKPHYTELNLLKIIAILGILLFHLLDLKFNWQIGVFFDKGKVFQSFLENNSLTGTILYSITSLGLIGVNIFFFVSGMGLAISSNKKKLLPLQFYKKRLFKIFPIYWVILILLVISAFLHNHQINLLDLSTHILGIHTFLPEFVFTYSPPFWFLGPLIQLYLLFPLLFYIAKKIHPSALLILSLLITFLLTPALIEIFGAGKFFSEYIFDFSIGIILAIYYPKIKDISKKTQLIASVFLTISTIAISLPVLFRMEIPLPMTAQTLLHPLLGLSFSILILIAFNGFQNKIINKYSTIIFPLFLTHHLFLTKIYRHFFNLPFIIDSIVFILLSSIIAYIFQTTLNKLYNHTKKFIKGTTFN